MSTRISRINCIVTILLALAGAPAAPALEVFQHLDEATTRIARLQDKPCAKLMDRDGYYQPESLIFQDVETGTEIWSLTQELCTELANIERRPVFSSDGAIMSLKGNRAFLDAKGQLVQDRWAGHNYLMDADLTHRRKLWVERDGQRTLLNSKFDTWDPRPDHPRTLYYAVDDTLYQVTVGAGLDPNVATVLYRFPNPTRKILQTISDEGILCIQDLNGKSPEDHPLFYIVDLAKPPGDPGFCQYHPLSYGGIQGVAGHDPRNEYRVHGIEVERGSRRVSWNYGPMEDVGEYVGFSVPIDHLDGPPTPRGKDLDQWGQYLSHPDRGPGGRCAYFAGPIKTPRGEQGGWGLWVRLHDADQPIYVAGPGTPGSPAPGGHVTWTGCDPDWFCASVSRHPTWKDQRFTGKLVVGKADGSVLRVLCSPFDRQRGGRAGYDAIPRPIQSPDATKCWFHSSMLMPSDQYTGSYLAVVHRPHAPIAVSYQDGELRWTPHPVSHEVKGYLLYRQTSTGWEQVTDTPPAPSAAWRYPARGTPGTYMLTALEWSGLESDRTSPTIALPAGTLGPALAPGWDRTAPAMPRAFTARRETPAPGNAGQYRLTWTAPPDKDVRYYNLYFSSAARPQPVQERRFASPPAGTTTYLDWTAPRTGPAHYALTAVDRQGNESAPAFADMTE